MNDGLKLFTVDTTADTAQTLTFDHPGNKWIVSNHSGGIIYVNTLKQVDSNNGFPVHDGETYIMVENENRDQFSPYSNTVSILPKSTSTAGVTVQMIRYIR